MTINVVCRRDAINRNRLAPLALVFTHDRRRKFVGLGISEALVHWDFDKQQPTADCPDRAEIQFQITSKIREYEKKIKKLEVLEIPVTFDTLFEQNGKRINCTVGEYFKQIIERLEKVEKYSSASKHKVTLVLVSQFRSVNMRFDELDLTYLREFEIFLSQKGNVNNSCNYAAFQYCRLYLIEILHQTTTHCKCIQFTLCCILSKFYIKPQLLLTVLRKSWSCILSKFYIKPQHPSKVFARYQSCILSKFYIKPQRLCRCSSWPSGCILSKFYIKPQHPSKVFARYQSCILSKFYIKPQRLCRCSSWPSGCILSKFYIKPQRVAGEGYSQAVVSYRNSTSNHNKTAAGFYRFIVVSYRNSTSNHNDEARLVNAAKVVSYRNSTSNHNVVLFPLVRLPVVSYRNSTSNHNKQEGGRNHVSVVSYRNSTSNHNFLC